jgi:hypothetical protein
MAAKARSGITNAIITELKKINGGNIAGGGTYSVDLANNITNKLIFWDEVNDFPFVSIVPGNEVREYHPGGFKWGHLGINIRAYVYGEEPLDELEKVLYEIEAQLERDHTLTYDTNKTTEQITVLSIATDEGLLAPYGVGEITCEIRYQVA